jgi:protein-L-isoaspartate(D-aspartate) O-methyltransferase
MGFVPSGAEGDEQHRLRDAMVDALVSRGVAPSPAVRDAFRAVPRDVFVPGVPVERAYAPDVAIPTRLDDAGIASSSASAPTIVAVMLEHLAVAPGDAVLEVGTGSGYNAALLARLVGSSGSVTSVELDPVLADDARRRLAGVGARVEVLTGDGWLGAPHRGPFDRIIVTVGVGDIAPAWSQQLRPDGRLVVPLWLGPGLQLAVAFEHRGDGLRSVGVDWCGFMPLRGPHAGPQRQVAAGEWHVDLLDPSPADEELLRALLDRAPRPEPAPVTAPWWFGRLALRDPDGIMVVSRADWRRRGWGIFDRAGSAAFVVDGELVRFGTDDACARLRTFLDSCAPFDIGSLVIDAIPTPNHIDASPLTVRRRDHVFVIDEPAPPARREHPPTH